MSISRTFGLVYQVAGGSAQLGGTTPGFDTTGQTHILIGVKHEGAVSTITPSSTAVSGSWTSHTARDGAAGDLHTQYFSAALTTTAAAQTASIDFNGTDTRPWCTMGVWLMNSSTGAIFQIAEANNFGTSAAPDGGTLSNAGGNNVVGFMLSGEHDAVTHTASTGWTRDYDLAGAGAGNYTAGFSRGSETTTSIDPACTQSGSSPWAVVSLLFSDTAAGGGGGPTGPPPGTLLMMGAGT